jgi:hypothetical protein
MKWMAVERTLGKLALCAVLSAIIAPCATLLTGFLGDRGAPVPTFIGMLADRSGGLLLAGYFCGSFVILAMIFRPLRSARAEAEPAGRRHNRPSQRR